MVTIPEQTAIIPYLRNVKPPRRDPWGEDEGHPAVPTAERVHVHSIGVWPWLTSGLVMAALGAAGITRRTLWTGEATSRNAAAEPWSDMYSVVTSADGPYLALLRAWTDLAGTSNVAIRIPSLVAMIFAVALVAALGARLATRWVGIAAGLILALLPSSTRYAQQADSTAVTMFAGVLATCLLVAALRRPAIGRWTGYLLAVALLGLLNPVALLLLSAHGWVVVAQYRHRTLGWLIAAQGAVPGLLLAGFGGASPGRFSGIAEPDRLTWLFPAALVGAAPVAALLLVVSLFSLPLRRPVATYTAWAVLPPSILLIVAQFTQIRLRDLAVILPAWALLAATALGRVRPPWSVPAAVVVVAALSVPAQLDLRGSPGNARAGGAPGSAPGVAEPGPVGNRIGDATAF
jgi:mannosyltransferase